LDKVYKLKRRLCWKIKKVCPKKLSSFHFRTDFSNHPLRLWSTYNLRFNLLSCQSVNLRRWHEIFVTRMPFNSMATLNFIKLGSLLTWLWYFRHGDFIFHVLCIRIYIEKLKISIHFHNIIYRHFVTKPL
jgi:hypothetical protein